MVGDEALIVRDKQGSAGGVIFPKSSKIKNLTMF